MRIVHLAVRNLFRNSRRNMVLGLLVAGCAAIMALGNAFLDGTDSGVRKVYAEGFTGDLSASARSGQQFSLFGNQTPIVGDLSLLPVLPSYSETRVVLDSTSGIERTASLVSGQVLVESGDYRKPAFVFGIEPHDYFALFPGIVAQEGRLLIPGEPGIMITRERVEAIGKSTGKVLVPGDSVRLSVFSSLGFSIVELPLRGILSYPVCNETLDSIVLADAASLKNLLGMVRNNEAAGPKAAPVPVVPVTAPIAASDIDSLFSGASDSAAQKGEGISLGAVEQRLKASASSELPKPDPDKWNYILIKLKKGVDAERMKKTLSANPRLASFGVRIDGWRGTSGDSALFVSWIRVVFNIGMGIVFFGAAIILVNALMMAVVERTGEIGTMRALGAGKDFVAGLFFWETLILTLSASLIGTTLGASIAFAIAASGIPVGNQVLVTLFGSTTLKPVVTLRTLVNENLGIALVGALVWIFPVRYAVKIQPVRALAAE